MDRFSNLEETISFWARNDSVIINNLLCGYIDEVWKFAQMAIDDNKGILKEYADGIRTINGEFDKRWIEILQNRLFENLEDKDKKEKILEIARSDISNILSAMIPTKNEMLLYRTVWAKRKELGDVLSCNVNDIVEFKNISSTCTHPIWENDGKEFYRYEITVPPNSFVLELDQFAHHNEKGEVLLPPMKCKIKNKRDSDNENCKGIIELEYIEKLPVRIDM